YGAAEAPQGRRDVRDAAPAEYGARRRSAGARDAVGVPVRASGGLAREAAGHAFHVICWTSVYSSMPHLPPSRPTPLSLKPPKGATWMGRGPLLTQTTRVGSRSAASTALPPPLDEMPPPSP